MIDLRDRLEKIQAKIEKLAIHGKEKTQDYYQLIDDFIEKGQYGDFELCLFYYYFIDISDVVSAQDVKMKTWPEILLQTQSPFLKKLGKLYKTKNVYQQSYDIYTMDPNVVQISLSQPLSITYSILPVTQSVSFIRDNEKIKLNITNPNTYRVSISKADWKIVDGVDTPTSIDFFEKIEISASFSTYTTEIPTTHASQYVVTAQERYVEGITGSVFNIYNYKLSINKSPLLGQIREIETVKDDKAYQLDVRLSKINGNIITTLQVDKVGSTSSVIISSENPRLSYDSNLLTKYTSAINLLLS